MFYAIAPPQAVQFLSDAVVLRLHKKEATFDKQTSLHEVHAHFYAMFSQANAALGTHSAAIPMRGASVYRGTCATWHVCNMARVQHGTCAAWHVCNMARVRHGTRATWHVCGMARVQHGTRATWHVSYAACNIARVQHGTCHAACNMARHRCVGLRAVALSRLCQRDEYRNRVWMVTHASSTVACGHACTLSSACCALRVAHSALLRAGGIARHGCIT